MKITKELLKKLVREAYEEEMGSEDESGEGYEGTPDDDGDDDLTGVPDESPGEPSAGPLSESIKRRFARLANIKHKK